MNKRGLSPIIATVILISIALVLALIIFLWARSFVSEKVQKFGEPVEFACDKISFDAEAILENGELQIDIVNRGEVALYGFEIRKKGIGSIEDIGISSEDNGLTRGSIRSGETGGTQIIYDGSSGDEILVIPMIVGEVGDIRKAYTCDEKYGVSVNVI